MTLNEVTERLKEAGVAEARHEAMLLVSSIFDIPYSRLMLEGDRDLSDSRLEKAVSRRQKREPLQYILGSWQFMNETYRVTPEVLIPRADTEVLVEFAIKSIPRGGRFADLCSGSGCVGISTLAAREDLTCVSVEKYPGAFALTVENGEANGVSRRLSAILGDVTEDVFEKEGRFDAILSNPPYVTEAEYESLDPELYFEPKVALTDGGDGLSVIRRIIEIYPDHLKDGGFLALEIGADQAEAVSRIASECGLGYDVLKDHSGHDRVIVMKKK